MVTGERNELVEFEDACPERDAEEEDVAMGAGAGAEAGVSCTVPLSSTDGSVGGGPSIAQRRDSYFERMNESILLG